MFDPSPFLRALEGVIMDGDLVTDAKIGTRYRIRLPADLPVSPAPTDLRRYDGMSDEMVPVTQEWVDLASRTMTRLYLELQEARREIDHLKLMASMTIAPQVEEPEADRIWRTIQAAASR